MALADLDNDGDQDVIVNNLNDGACVYRNECPAPRLAVRLRGKSPNTEGIGARITVLGGPVTQSQEMISGGRYLSSDQPLRVFAASEPAKAGTPNTNGLTIRVKWRSGRESVVTRAKANCIYEIAEERAAAAIQGPMIAPGQTRQRLFEDASSAIAFTHHQELFNDFERQPQLANKLSQSGPGIAWFDIDGDGDDDLLIGNGRGGQFTAYRNDAGKFTRIEQPVLNERLARDQTAVLGIATDRLKPGLQTGESQRRVVAGMSSYEDAASSAAAACEYDLGQGTRTDILPPLGSSVGPVCAADIDGDGDLDLFVGGRVVAAKYPQAASSYLFKNNNGEWRQDVEGNKAFEAIGLVSGAVFSDIDGDGDPDLVLACEWGPVRVFRNVGGKFTDATAAFGLDKFLGWWNGVATGDFDNDGKLDIIASNWGHNTRYESHRAEPLRIYFGELGDGRGNDLVEAHFDNQLRKIVPERGLDLMSKTMPFIRERFQTHEAYAQASVEEIFGERLKTARQWQANWLESTVFLNRGEHFEARALPVEAQMAPAFGICVADFDGDGNEDIFVAQNFFATQPDIPRYDAGTGLIMKGNGRGGFTATSVTESGIRVDGEQRGCAASDYDGDGRVDLLVAQNGAAARLYHNVAAEAGVRIRLVGSVHNPDAIGATIRAGDEKSPGPLRELRAGGGYLSQSSSVQVFPKSTSHLRVRWPDKRTIEVAVPPGSREITIDSEGTVRTAPTK